MMTDEEVIRHKKKQDRELKEYEAECMEELQFDIRTYADGNVGGPIHTTLPAQCPTCHAIWNGLQWLAANHKQERYSGLLLASQVCPKCR